MHATRLAVIICGLCVIAPISLAAKKQKPPLVKTYEATTTDKAFVAMALGAGSTLVSQVKEACLVNFKFGNEADGWYTVANVSAVCKDEGDGKVSITLNPQVNTNRFRVGSFVDDNLTRFWATVDHQLIPAAAPTAPAK